jgi:signal transduction histidine kinase
MSTERMQVAMRPGQSSKPGGMGLGLMVVRSIVRQHQARLRMTSAPGRGSQVSITFPLITELPEAEIDDPSEVETGPLKQVGEES